MFLCGLIQNNISDLSEEKFIKAARLYEPGTPLKVEEIPEPKLRPSGAIIRILSTHIPSFSHAVMSGELGYAFPKPFPFTPGTNAVGIVEAVADDVFGLEIGQKVFCDPFISSKQLVRNRMESSSPGLA
jgi:alcohol dehydrogenase